MGFYRKEYFKLHKKLYKVYEHKKVVVTGHKAKESKLYKFLHNNFHDLALYSLSLLTPDSIDTYDGEQYTHIFFDDYEYDQAYLNAFYRRRADIVIEIHKEGNDA